MTNQRTQILLTPADLANTIAAAREGKCQPGCRGDCPWTVAVLTLQRMGFVVHPSISPSDKALRAAERYLALWQRLEREHRMSGVAEGHDCSETSPDAWCYDTCQALAQAAGETTGGAE